MKFEDYVYDEGDNCPKCKKGILAFNLCQLDGINYLKCQDCNYDATDDVYREVTNN